MELRPEQAEPLMKTAPALAGRTGQGAPWWHWWAWLPVLAVAATIAVLSFARIPATAEPELAAWLYNIVVVGAAFLGSLLAGRAYLAGGGRLAAALGASMLIFGVGCVVGMTLAM